MGEPGKSTTIRDREPRRGAGEGNRWRVRGAEKNRNVIVDIQDPLGNVGFFLMNHLHPLFKEVRGRRAILMALSQKTTCGPSGTTPIFGSRCCQASSLLARRSTMDAQSTLGFLYEYGKGVRQDDAAAASWYRKAANQGSARAQVDLGYMYDHGQGVPRDYVAAHMWFSLAAAGGLKQARTSRDVVAAKMTPEQIAEAEKRFAEWQRGG
jgi:hypothetical protein